MKWTSHLVSNYVRTINLAAICLLSLGLIMTGPQVAPYVSGTIITVLYYPFSKIKTTVENALATAEENARLQLLLRETTLRLSSLSEIQRENIRLQKILDFEAPPGYRLLPARVISISGTVVPTNAVINKGSRDGVVQGMPVINQIGLVGRVITALEEVATIELLTNPANRVAAKVAESRQMGIVRYRTRDGMILDNFPILGDIEVGYQIISSGLGGVFPPGLVIGTVRDVDRPPEETFCRVEIEPAADFNSLEELFVLKESRQ
ncbi:MAG: rod shape-determining protein MreC [Candidatus Zixiibacteriota bacterium]